MPSTIVLGAQWGDEGKGKIVNLLASKMDFVVRFQGGANAGHTLVIDGRKIVLHQIPSGIFNHHCQNIITGGCVVDPESLVDEVDSVVKYGEKVDHSRLKISSGAHVVTRMHKWIDAREGGAVGTTGRGIGPCYVSKARRIGIRLENFIDGSYKDLFNSMFDECVNLYGLEKEKRDEFFVPLQVSLEKIKPLIVDTRYIIHRAISENRNVLLEGAQGAMLDLDNGTYPFVTSSSTTIGGAITGSGVYIDFTKRVGVIKAYCTRVGNGPFPTELNDENGERLRKVGSEFGATTGRPRRCGWLDLKLMKDSCMFNGFNSLALTKLDCLSGFEKIKVAVEHDLNGKPIYREFDGWKEDISKVQSPNDLPTNCRRYISFIEEYLGVPFSIVSLGADRDRTLILELEL
ncbi:MAG: adenylosuccinate synthase [Candidatus Riflebacteria bacterium]|nr:adenylosuccinate synthase [Candidatus Riflebacteria bacterium]